MSYIKKECDKPWGVFCRAAIDYNPMSPPRYVFETRREAREKLREADKECSSKSGHFVRRVRPAETSKHTDWPNRAKYEAELSKAFKASAAMVNREKQISVNGLWGQGCNLGKRVIAEYMPKWFQDWDKEHNWIQVGLINGEAFWWSWVGKFGLSVDEWWDTVRPFIDACEKKSKSKHESTTGRKKRR